MTQAYPLQWPEGWPRTPDHQRKNYGPFKTTFEKAKRELFDELRRLGTSNVVVSSWLPVRNDGMPYGDQARRRIPDPGCAVYFTRDNRQIVIARDVYGTVHDNLRSIGLAVEYLRGLERHGGAHMMERAFSGFAALPPPRHVPTWREVFELEGIEGPPFVLLAAAGAVYKKMAREAHPDRIGGSHERMAVLNRAYEEAKKECGDDGESE